MSKRKRINTARERRVAKSSTTKLGIIVATTDDGISIDLGNGQSLDMGIEKAIEVQRKTGLGLIKAAARDSVDKTIKSTADRDKSKKAAEERVFAELVAAGAVIDKGKKLTVRVVRSDEEE